MASLPSWLTLDRLKDEIKDAIKNGVKTGSVLQAKGIEKLELIEARGQDSIVESFALILGAFIADYHPGWNNLSLSGSWASSGGSGYYAPTYVKDVFGKVKLRGTMNGGTSGAVAFTLPSGYRPTLKVGFSLPFYNGTYGSAYLVVENNGNVRVYFTGSVGEASLDGVQFYAG